MVQDVQVVLVGAGFGGMGAAIELNKLGYKDLVILDRMDDLGGTWHINQYPGIAVDIPSSTYSYSFEPNPNWSRLYAPGDELKSYAEHVADKYELRQYMRYGREVKKAVYDEENQNWAVDCVDITTGKSESYRAQFLVMATGFLSQPKYPDIPGLENFEGKTMHTAAWDHDYDLKGKRASVIGTGATSVQLLPEIAPELEQLNVYQRTPIWVTPKLDRRVSDWTKKAFANIPLVQKTVRLVGSSILEIAMVIGALYNKQFPSITKRAEAVCKAHLRRQIKDPDLRKKLTPDYNFGCKRPTFSNHYYPTFNRDNVDLVVDRILRIEKNGIVTLKENGDEELKEVDTLILATGFKMWEEGNFPACEVIGKSQQGLRDYWLENGYQSYDGITIEGFPNFFNLASPYAFTGLSYFFTIEGQMKHINRCLTEMRALGAKSFEVKESAQAQFVEDMRERLENSIFVNANCATSNSYYFNGRGEANLLRPTSTVTALWRAGHFPKNDYRFE